MNETEYSDEECREMECFIAEHLRGYTIAPVGKDYDGENAGEVLVPPGWGKGGGYTYPPRGPIPRGWHVPKWSTDEWANWELIRWMKEHGSTLALVSSVKDQEKVWEVTWVRGQHYHGVHNDLKLAVCLAAMEAVKEEQDKAGAL